MIFRAASPVGAMFVGVFVALFVPGMVRAPVVAGTCLGSVCRGTLGDARGFSFPSGTAGRGYTGVG